MKKILVVAAILFALTACGSTATKATPAKTVSSDTPSVALQVKQASKPMTPDVKTAVRNYSHYYLTGNGYKAYDLMSKSCKAKVDKNELEGETLAAKSQYGDEPIKTISVESHGDTALVTYSYTSPVLDQHSQPWVLENGAWKYDDC